MIITFTQTLIIFIAVFISAYLLSWVVDFESDYRGVKLPRVISAVLFPFFKLEKYNVSSVCLQTANYIQMLVYCIFKITNLTLDIAVQTVLLLGAIILTVMFIIIINKRLRKKSKDMEEINNDR